MREIRFRAWEARVKKYIDWDNFMNNPFGTWGMKAFNNERYHFQQYTGLKDDNGKEIYEGDIVDYLGDIDLVNSNVLRVIEYKEEEACFVARLPVGVEGEVAVYLNEHDFKLIGNIYENPELLEETA